MHETSSSKESETARSRKVVLTIQSLCFDIQQISSAVKIPQSPLLFSSMQKPAAYTAAEGVFIYLSWSHPKRNKPHNLFLLQSFQHGESRGLRKGTDFRCWWRIWGLEKDGRLPREGNKFPGLVLLKLQFLLFFVKWLKPENCWTLLRVSLLLTTKMGNDMTSPFTSSSFCILFSKKLSARWRMLTLHEF